MISPLLLLIILVITPGCWQGIPITQEFNELKRTTKNITGSDILYEKCQIQSDESIEQTLALGLSRDQAVSIALMNNPRLRAYFEKLGIAKADLVQAGLFTNPQSNNVFRIPLKGEPRQTNIESVTTMALSDLWQIPLRSKVYEDELEIVTLRILTLILDIIEHTKNAYDSCVYTNLQCDNAEIMVLFTKELKDEIYYRQPFGYSSDRDLYNANVQLAVAKAMYVQRKEQQQRTLLHLRELLGIAPTAAPITFTDTILADVTTPRLQELESYALDARPEIIAARLKIRRYEDTIRLEKSRIFKRVDFGIGFKQDFEKPFHGWGPALNMELPAFDTNFAQVAKAEFEMERAKKRLRMYCLMVQRQVRDAFITVNNTRKEAEYYAQEIIPAREHTVDYEYTYAQTLQLNMITPLQAQLELYKAEEHMLDKYYKLHTAYNALERAYGMKIIRKSV